MVCDDDMTRRESSRGRGKRETRQERRDESNDKDWGGGKQYSERRAERGKGFFQGNGELTGVLGGEWRQTLGGIFRACRGIVVPLEYRAQPTEYGHEFLV